MPCTYYSPEEEAAIQDMELKKEMQKVNELTRLLCISCERMDKDSVIIPQEVRSWWLEHQERDRLRKKEEKQRHQLKAGMLQGEIMDLKQKLASKQQQLDTLKFE